MDCRKSAELPIVIEANPIAVSAGTLPVQNHGGNAPLTSDGRYTIGEMSPLTGPGETARILSAEVIELAVRRLAQQGVNVEQLGDDPLDWYRSRLRFPPLARSSDCVEATLSHRQSAHIGLTNHRRDTLAWKALVALMEVYQEDSYSTPSAAPAVGKGWRTGKSGDFSSRIPTFIFHYVNRRFW